MIIPTMLGAISMEDNRRVLIIDDNEAIHHDFQKVIGINPNESNVLDQVAQSLFQDESPQVVVRRRYELDSAYQGQEGLDLVKQARDRGKPYALAFIDVRMPPGWDGIETSQRLWEIDADLQVVICTAYSDYSWNDMVAKLGETDRFLVVKKPFDNIEIRQIACALTMKWSLGRQARRNVVELSTLVDCRTAALAVSNEKLVDDAVERQRTAEVLHRSEVRIRAIVENADDGVISTDAFGNIDVFNPVAEIIFGYKADEVLGKNISVVIPSEYGIRHEAITEPYRTTKKNTGVRVETQGRKKDGKAIPIEMLITVACAPPQKVD